MANSESSQHPDLQDLVAYLQGRGDETLRAQVLKRLDEDESYLELMVDLVPMLRAAGEIADPDAEDEDGGHVAGPSPPAPSAAPLPFVAPPPSPTSSPLPARSPAAARSRRWPAAAALAALVPIAVAVWLMNTWSSNFLQQALAEGLPAARLPPIDSDPITPSTKRSGSPEPEIDPEVAQDFFYIGARLMDLQLQLEQRSLEPAKKAFKEFEAAAGIYSVDFSEVSLELEKPKVNWGKAEEALQTAYRGAFEKPEMYEALEQGSCIRAAWLAVEANDPGFLAKSKISEHCQRLVGPNWTADEKLLRQMLKEQTTDVEPETRRGM